MSKKQSTEKIFKRFDIPLNQNQTHFEIWDSIPVPLGIKLFSKVY